MYPRLNVRREVLLLLLYTVICNLVFINAGGIIGYSSVVLPILANNTSSIVLNSTEIPLFASIIYFSAIVGSFLCPLALKYGRRCNMIICGVTYSLGWSLIASSYNVIQLFIGRTLTGIAMGISYYSIEVYLEEISTASWREVLTSSSSVGTSAGVLIVYFLGFIIQDNWKLIAAFFIVPSISIVLWNIFFLCESPVWLLLKGRKEAARIALLRIRGLRQETIEFQEEFAIMVNYIELTNNLETLQNRQSDFSSTKKTEKWFLIRSKLKNIQRISLLPEVWKPFVIINCYFLFQQFSGLRVITSYSVDILIRINITVDPFLITVVFGIIQLICCMVMSYCSKRIGRRTISIVSGVGMSIFLSALIVYLQFFENTDVTAVPLACILLYMGFGHFGFYPIPWAMIPELYPTKYINGLGLLTSLIVHLNNYISVELYPMMVTQDRNVTFFFYCIVSILATIFVTIVLPETRGKTKKEIEEGFRGKLKIEETSRKIENDAYK